MYPGAIRENRFTYLGWIYHSNIYKQQKTENILSSNNSVNS